MTVPRLEYDSHGLPKPYGVRKACVKMSMIEAELGKALPLAVEDAALVAQIRAEMGPMRLSDEEAIIAARVGVFMCSEYSRLSDACEEKDKLIAEQRQQILSLEERVRDLSGETQATDGGE